MHTLLPVISNWSVDFKDNFKADVLYHDYYDNVKTRLVGAAVWWKPMNSLHCRLITVQTVLTATFDRQLSTPHKINTSELMEKKFGTIDYVRERTSYAKFGRNLSTGGFWENDPGEI